MDAPPPMVDASIAHVCVALVQRAKNDVKNLKCSRELKERVRDTVRDFVENGLEFCEAGRALVAAVFTALSAAHDTTFKKDATATKGARDMLTFEVQAIFDRAVDPEQRRALVRDHGIMSPAVYIQRMSATLKGQPGQSAHDKKEDSSSSSESDSDSEPAKKRRRGRGGKNHKKTATEPDGAAAAASTAAAAAAALAARATPRTPAPARGGRVGKGFGRGASRRNPRGGR